MAASSETPIILKDDAPTAPVGRPLFSSDPIEYIKLVSEEGHIFIIDKDAAMRYSSTIKDNMSISDDMDKQSTNNKPTCSSSLSDDGESSVSSVVTNAGPTPISQLDPIEFREIPTKAMDKCCQFFYWKKRWANVVTERIPDFPTPTEKVLALNTLVASNELRC